MWWIAAGRMRDLAVFLAAITGSLVVAAGSIAETKSIFTAWIDPWGNPELGNASIQSSFALAGGGLTGTGPGGGSADLMQRDRFIRVRAACRRARVYRRRSGLIELLIACRRWPTTRSRRSNGV